MIRAEVHSDDYLAVATFDATAFFAAATKEDLDALASCGWRGDYPADAVALFMEGKDPQVDRVFAYLAFKPTMPDGDPVGFECSVSEKDAHAWVAAHHPDWLYDLWLDGEPGDTFKAPE